MMKNLLYLLLLLLIACKSNPLFKAVELDPSVSSLVSDGTLLVVNDNVLDNLKENKKDKITIDLPYGDTIISLVLDKISLFDPAFKVNGVEFNGELGVFYAGKVKDQPGSYVTISIFDNNITGIVSSSFGELTLNKQTDIQYLLGPVVDTLKFECGTTEIDPDELRLLKEVQSQIEPQLAVGTSCVTVDFELTHEVYKYFNGNVQSCINWMTSLFSGVKALYKNENIDISIKSIYVHTTDDGYSDNPATALNELRARRTNDVNFTGNLVHLVRGQSSSLSGIAYVDVLCKPSFRYGFSAVTFSFPVAPAPDQIPPYSWSTMVVTHELGHNLGSPHTHSCSWPGGPIDNCVTQEGDCPPGPTPSNGGTIMSYCHMTNYGIKFSNGFGPKPGDLIRSRVANGACLPCSVVPTCSDVIKNGNETGVDCGGSCTPCSVIVPVSENKPITQSSNYNSANSYPASKANDGRVGGANFSHTANEIQPWIQIDLGASVKATSIEITNRGDCCGNRLKRFKIFITDVPPTAYSQNAVYTFNVPSGLATNAVFTNSNLNGATGRYVRIWMDNTGYGANPLHLAEIKVFGTPTTGLCPDTIKVFRDSIVIIKIPKDSVILKPCK